MTTLRDKLLPAGPKGAAGAGAGAGAPELPFEHMLHPALSQLLGTNDPQGLLDEVGGVTE